MKGGNGDWPELPPGWVWVKLERLVEVLDSRRVPVNQKEREARCAGKSARELFPYYGATGQAGYIDDYIFDEDAILLGEDGAPFLDRNRQKAYLVSGKYWVNNHAHILRSRIPELNEFLCHQLNWIDYSKYVGGTTRLKLTQGDMLEIDLAIPPPKEAAVISDRISHLFGEIEAGEQELEKAREGLETYRRGMLKAAVTGELTKEWRERDTPSETGADLLARILKERRTAWERTERAKMRGKGQPRKSDAWKARYEEPQAPRSDNPYDLPSGWTWASLDQLAWQSSYGTSEKCSPDATGIAVLRIPNVQDGEISLANLKYAKDDLELDRADLICPGDLLVVRTNGSEDLIGRGAVCFAEPSTDVYFASYLIRFRLVSIELLWRWLSLYWRSHVVRDLVREHAATSAGQYNVSQSKLLGFPVPLPPAAELQQIVLGLEGQLDGARALHATLRDEADVTRLRQSVLSAAFAGKLVPQDPADEPASQLLDRIRAARATAPAARRTRSRFVAEVEATRTRR